MDSPLPIAITKSRPISLEDILLQYVFEDELGVYPLDGMVFEPHKEGTRIIPGGGRGDVLYGRTDNGNLIWDANGNLYVAGPHSKGFLAHGKLGHGSVLSNTENVGDGDDALFGSATMLATLLESPVVQNLVAGHGPKGETNGADKQIVSNARKKFASPKQPFFPEGTVGTYAAWPRLMRFIGAVNDAFNKRQDRKGIPNPLVDLMFGNARGRDRDLGDAMLHGGFDKIGLEKLLGESDEAFYKRQADNINRHMEALNLRDEVSAEKYYDWVIDKMVRNLQAAANALSERDRALRGESLARRRSRVSMHIASENEARKKVDEERRKSVPSYGRILALIDKYSKDIEEIEAAREKVKSWPERNSLADRIASIEKKREAAAKLNASAAAELEKRRKDREEEKRKKDNSFDKVDFNRAKSRLTGAMKASKAMEEAASLQMSELRKLEGDAREDYSVGFCLTWLGNFKGAIEDRLQELKNKRDRLAYPKPSGIKQETFMPGIRMYQMALPRGEIVTLGNYFSREQAVAPVINSNMRMVAAGILLGGTGMPLEEVKKNCDKYFMLRLTRKHGREAFIESFGIDPTRIPSDERLKDFHHNWKRIGDARDTQRNIINAVHRRFF